MGIGKLSKKLMKVGRKARTALGSPGKELVEAVFERAITILEAELTRAKRGRRAEKKAEKPAKAEAKGGAKKAKKPAPPKKKARKAAAAAGEAGAGGAEAAPEAEVAPASDGASEPGTLTT
jgi:hypothetical protein